MQTNSSPAPAAIRFLRLSEVLKTFPVSRSTWYAGVRDGKFPKPIKLSGNCSAWRADEIDELCARVATAK